MDDAVVPLFFSTQPVLGVAMPAYGDSNGYIIQT
jgi:hypothetical protein